MTALTAQNEAEASGSAAAGRFRAVLAYALGLLVTGGALAVWEATRPYLAHSSRFYLYAAVPFPWMLGAALRALRLRWPATTVALVYMALFLVMGWVLAPWPATPKLGPIYQNVTHMVTLGFPLLLAVPALAFDLLQRALPRAGAWPLSAALGLAFVAAMLATHWWFGAFLLSPASHNAVFMGDHLPYVVPKAAAWARGAFLDLDGSPAALLRGLAVAAAAAVLSARVGLGLGGWMRRVRR
jgi:hypothetical protein